MANTDDPDFERRNFLAGVAVAGLLCAGGAFTGLTLAPTFLMAAGQVLGDERLLTKQEPTTGTVIRTLNRYKQPKTATSDNNNSVNTFRFSSQEPDLNIPAPPPVARTASIQPASIQPNTVQSGGIQPGFRMGSTIPRKSQVVVNLPKTRGICAYNANVGEQVKLAFVRDGYYDPGALTAIDWLLRDYHYGRYLPMSRRLYDVLYVTQFRYGFNRPLVITSGYRTPSTNKLLAERVPGVGRRSYHLRGEAVDFNVPGVPMRDLANFMLALGVGGVGLYPRHVHVDVGPLRSWA